jgi:hypothetical protein
VWARLSPEPEVISNCSHSGCVEWSCQLGEKGWVNAWGDNCSTSGLDASRDASMPSAASDQYLYHQTVSGGLIAGMPLDGIEHRGPTHYHAAAQHH